jgi:peptidoglycan hydrolase-like protein with peptidoglycan-binding domain
VARTPFDEPDSAADSIAGPLISTVSAFSFREFAIVAFANGVTREDAKSAQESLKAKGLYDGEVDGVMGPKTRRALREYQKSEGLAVTGRLDTPMVEKIGVRL